MEAIINYSVRFATVYDQQYAQNIADEITLSAQLRGVSIKPRTADYIFDKMINGLAVIAIDENSGEWLGFCALDVWIHEKYVANTALIVRPQFRGKQVSLKIKTKLFELARMKFTDAKIFSLTNNKTIYQINLEQGFMVISNETLTSDPYFTNGGNSWVNFSEMMQHSNESGHVAMVYDPVEANIEKNKSLRKLAVV